MLLPTLYKRTSTGAVQVWRRELDGSRYRSISGQKDGAQVESGWVQAQGKNIGKTNETTPERQAELECEAAYTLKLAQGGYHENEADIDQPKYFKPMLAKQYEEYPVTDFTGTIVYSQPKLDGVRCVTTIDGMWSRQGKPIDTCPHILEQLAPLFEKNPDAILDGELYADKFNDDFNAIISLIRKKKPDAAHFAETAANVEYHVYDYPSVDGGFDDRYSELVAALFSFDHPSIVIVPTDDVSSQEQMDKFSAQYTEEGYEGQMIRLDGPYKNGRSTNLLKRKIFQDQEYRIVSINEGEGNRSGMAGYITYRLPDGREFGSGIKGSWDYARQLLRDADKYVGGEGTVRFQNLTPDGIPRFPVTVAVYEGNRDI